MPQNNYVIHILGELRDDFWKSLQTKVLTLATSFNKLVATRLLDLPAIPSSRGNAVERSRHSIDRALKKVLRCSAKLYVLLQAKIGTNLCRSLVDTKTNMYNVCLV